MSRHSSEHLLMRGVTVKTLSVLLSPEKHGKLPVFFAETAYALAVINQENANATI